TPTAKDRAAPKWWRSTCATSTASIRMRSRSRRSTAAACKRRGAEGSGGFKNRDDAKNRNYESWRASLRKPARHVLSAATAAGSQDQIRSAMPVALRHSVNLISAILSLPAEPNASDLTTMIAHGAQAARKTVRRRHTMRRGDNSGDFLREHVFPDAVQRVAQRLGNASLRAARQCRRRVLDACPWNPQAYGHGGGVFDVGDCGPRLPHPADARRRRRSASLSAWRQRRQLAAVSADAHGQIRRHRPGTSGFRRIRHAGLAR